MEFNRATVKTQLFSYYGAHSAKELRGWGQTRKLPGAWKAKKDDLVLALAKDDLNILEHSKEAESYMDTLEGLLRPVLLKQGIEVDLRGGIEVEPEPTIGLDELLESYDKVAAPKVKPRTKTRSMTYTIENLSDEDIAHISERSTITAPSCKDPNRHVVKRTVLAELICEKTGIRVTPATFNQLVITAASRLPRQPLTIKSASRFKYLLMENDSALWVTDWILGHLVEISFAERAAEDAAERGYQALRSSKK